MRTFKIILLLSILAGTVLVTSCQKDSVDPNNSLVCYVETETDYFTRNCFQLNDGSYIIVGTGDANSVIARFSEKGDLIWQKNLDDELFNLIKGIPLPSGGFVLAGFDKTGTVTNSNGILYIKTYDNNGNLTNSKTIQSIPTAILKNRLDFILLRNGNLAFLLNPYSGISAHPRLIITNQNLTTIFDQNYSPGSGQTFQNLLTHRIQEGIDGSIYIIYKFLPNNLICTTTALMKLNGSDYSLNFISYNTGLGCSEISDSFVIDDNGNNCIASAKQFNPTENKFAYYHNREEFSLGYEVSVVRNDTAGNYIDRHDYSGFNLLGSIMKIIRTRDGGFLMVGTSGQNSEFTTVSNTQVFLIKTDRNLNQLWMKQFKTTYPAVGYDVFETSDGGYAIGIFEKSFNKNFKMMIIKTNANGN